MMLEDHASGEFSYPAIIEGKTGGFTSTYTYRVKNQVCLPGVEMRIEVSTG